MRFLRKRASGLCTQPFLLGLASTTIQENIPVGIMPNIWRFVWLCDCSQESVSCPVSLLKLVKV